MSTPALQAADPLALATSVAEAMTRQPELFGEAAFSELELETVRVARSGRYNGSITTRNEARVAVVVALRQQGCSLREIERRTGMDTRLVNVVMREAERAGVVPAIKEVLNRRIAETTERVMDRFDEEVKKDEPDSQLVRALAVAMGVGYDKVAAGSNPAGDVHLHLHQHAEGGDPTREYLRQRAAALATESESVVVDAISTPIPSDSGAAADVAASVGLEPGDQSAPPADPDRPTATPADPAGRAGGGSATRAVVAGPYGLLSENFEDTRPNQTNPI
jgi:transposase